MLLTLLCCVVLCVAALWLGLAIAGITRESHQLLIEKLTAVAEGNISNLAVFMPPGSAKSTYCSILFVPWYLARFQNKSIIAASHTIELAEKWGQNPQFNC